MGLNSQGGDPAQVAESWETYWHGSGEAGAFSSGGVSHPDIDAFWDEFFRAMVTQFESPRMLDLASGSGAVVERALAIAGEGWPAITCVDVSQTAIDSIEKRFPGTTGLVADARSIPLDSGSFDIVTSQFGIEYAGIDAIGEAARLVAAGGRLVLMLHSNTSTIYAECAASLDAIKRMQEASFIARARELLDAGFNAVRGADRAPYDAAGKKLAPAIAVMEAIMEEHGQRVAGDTIARLYDDVRRIHSRIQGYDPREVLGWLDRMNGEVEAYATRMASMCEAAIDKETFREICSNLAGKNFELLRADALLSTDSGRPLAWIVNAERAHG